MVEVRREREGAARGLKRKIRLPKRRSGGGLGESKKRRCDLFIGQKDRHKRSRWGGRER